MVSRHVRVVVAWGLSLLALMPKDLVAHFPEGLLGRLGSCRGWTLFGGGTYMLAWWSAVPLGLAVTRPGDFMAVYCTEFCFLVEEGGWVGVVSSCCSGTRDTSRKPGPHSL